MYQEDYRAGMQSSKGDDVYSRPVRAGKRTYFFDVKATKGNDYYLTITESKRRVENDGNYVYDKHKIFLYKEDFEKFAEGLEDAVKFIKSRCTVVETRPSDSDEYQRSYAPAEERESVAKSYADIDFDEL